MSKDGIAPPVLRSGGAVILPDWTRKPRQDACAGKQRSKFKLHASPSTPPLFLPLFHEVTGVPQVLITSNRHGAYRLPLAAAQPQNHCVVLGYRGERLGMPAFIWPIQGGADGQKALAQAQLDFFDPDGVPLVVHDLVFPE